MIYYTRIKKPHDFCQVNAPYHMTEVVSEPGEKRDLVVSTKRGVIVLCFQCCVEYLNRFVMNEILVPTDLSANSRAGMRFAIGLATQTKQPLIFYHCMQYLRPTRWSEAQYESYRNAETTKGTLALRKFVAGVYKSARGVKPSFECFVEQQPDPSRAIINYALSVHVSAICMSTRGGGRLRKIVGTHASRLIHESPVPVFVIPEMYRRSPLKHILYASDLNAIGAELKQVMGIARTLRAKISVVHYDFMADVDDARKKLEALAEKYKAPGVTFRFQKYDVGKSLGQHLIGDMKAYKPSLVVLFTGQKRGWFDRLFLASKSVGVAYESRTPLLIIPKV